MRRRPTEGPGPILEGPVTRTLLGLSIPMILAMMLVTLFGVVDMFFLGRYSKESMAAVQFAFPVTYSLMIIAGALGTATTSLCSRLVGQDESERIRNLVLHVLGIVLGIAVLVTPAGILLLEPSIARTGPAPDVLELAVGYGRIIFAGSLIALLPMAVNSLFRGDGDTMFPFLVMSCALGTNAILDWLLIFGIGPFPRLGIEGAAFASLGGFALASMIVTWRLLTSRGRVRLDLSAWRFDPGLLRDLASVAVPAAIATGSTALSMYLINFMLAGHGTDVVAGAAAGIRVLSVVFLPTLGISMSMMVMVGQNHSAGNRLRVRRITLVTLGYAIGLLAALALPVILFPRQALSVFTDKPYVIAAGVPMVMWVTMARPMLSVANITALWFQARGQGWAGMVPNVVMRVLMEPLGLYLGLRTGDLVAGWKGMALGGFIGGSLCGLLLLWRLRVYVRAGAAGTQSARPLVS